MRNRTFIIKVAVSFLVIASGFAMRVAWENPPQALAQQDCTEVESFEGTGIQETQPFQVQSNTWRISYDWTATDPEFGGIFQIYVYDSETNSPVSIVSAEEPGSGESFVNEGAGSYYLNINTASAEWNIVVEDCGEPGGPPVEAPMEGPVEAPIEDPIAGPVEDQYGNNELIDAGGAATGPMPKMPDGSCPNEFPVERGSGCHVE